MIHETARISRLAEVEPGARIGPGCEIEAGAFVGKNAVLERGCKIGRNAILEGALSLGADGQIQTGVHIVHTGGPGAVFASQCILRSFAVVYDDVSFGRNVSVGHHSVIRPATVVGEFVSIGNLNQIEGRLSIGERTRFHSNVHISMNSVIGAGCFIAPGFVPTNTPYPLTSLADQHAPGVTMEDSVKVGANVTTAPGVRIGRNCLIGLGSVVLSDIAPDSFAAGNPCKVIKPITELYDKRSGTYPYRNDGK